jgi:hypothetical protein
MQTKTNQVQTGMKRSHFERSNYYFGKMLTVRDFREEQEYLNEKRWVLNSYGLGWGVLCGLKVKPHPEKSDTHIIVEPGFALDKNGNEIWVREEQVIELKDIEGEMPGSSPPDGETCFYVSIKYYECLVEPSPVPVENCGTVETDCIHNRVRESYKFRLSYNRPDLSDRFDTIVSDLLHCEIDCARFLYNPAPIINQTCPEREQCVEIPLAKVCREEDEEQITEEDIDNANFRKLAFSNEMLCELLSCLRKELWKAHGAKYDRKRNVPLLAQTIKGIRYQDGRIKSMEEVGTRPTRITSDGDYIWITDQETSEVLRIDRAESVILNDPKVNLPEKNWGIAFDGNNMWITHHETSPGKLTRVNVCRVSDRETISPEELPEFPEEIVFDGTYLWASHKWNSEAGGGSEEGSPVEPGDILYISKIDPETKMLLETIAIEPRDWSRPASSIHSMVFDGSALWFTYTGTTANQRGTNAVARKISNLDGEVTVGEPIILRGHEANDISFDGTHVWVTHDEGASKIDIHLEEELDQIGGERRQTAIAFDGNYLWMAEIGQNEARVNRADTFAVSFVGGEEIIRFQGKETYYQVSRICYDGSNLWVLAFKEEQGETKGIIHRLLP